MSRSIIIMVSDNQEVIEKARQQTQNLSEATFQVYAPHQWRDGLESPFFRQQLAQGVPALTGGLNAARSDEGQVLNFPTSSHDSHVQRMDDIEAKAIENAIVQYKGNLTEAAKALGIGRATLYRKVKQYHIDPSVARKKKMAA